MKKTMICAMVLMVLIGTSLAFQPTPTEFYGTVKISGKDADIGTKIVAYTKEGIWCGAYTTSRQGEYGLLSCNGDDRKTIEAEGATEGDLITFFVDGTEASLLEEAIWSPGSFQEIHLMVNTVMFEAPLNRFRVDTGKGKDISYLLLFAGTLLISVIVWRITKKKRMSKI